MSRQPQYVQDVDDVSEQELEGINVVEVRNRLRRSKPRPLTCLEYIFEWLLRCHPWKIIPSILASNAVSFSITTLCNCTLMHRKDELDVPSTEKFISFGLWSFREHVEHHPDDETSIWSYRPFQECIAFDAADHPANVDPVFRTARAMGILACCFGFLTACMLWLLAVVRANERPSSSWRCWTSIGLIICCLFEGLTLVVLRSKTCGGTCELGRGGETVITAVVLYFICTLIVICKWGGSISDADDYEGSELLPQSTTTSLADEEEPLNNSAVGMMTMMMIDAASKSPNTSAAGSKSKLAVDDSSDGRTLGSKASHSWFGSSRTMEMAPLTTSRSEDESDAWFSRGFMEAFEDEASLTMNTVVHGSSGASISSIAQEEEDNDPQDPTRHRQQQTQYTVRSRGGFADSFEEELTPPSQLQASQPPSMENERHPSSASSLMMSSHTNTVVPPTGDDMSTLTESSQSTGVTSSEAPRGTRQAHEHQHQPSTTIVHRASSPFRVHRQQQPSTAEKLNDLLDNAFES